ncbi:hypothetical protein QQF64_018804 [Cirrhinus molitorella]|uniref:RING-type domain-containing protein n=1 Tax=Cirrhinus molitorella TaxID=172907 RepID=A0ABR3LDR6_9TELE
MESAWMTGMEAWLLFCHFKLSSTLPMKSLQRAQLTLAAMFPSFPAEESLGMKAWRLRESRVTHAEGWKENIHHHLPTSEDDLCPICYAHSISAIFKPCSHKSCKACINQHLMNNKDCFFCKATITGVDDYTKPASS